MLLKQEPPVLFFQDLRNAVTANTPGAVPANAWFRELKKASLRQSGFLDFLNGLPPAQTATLQALENAVTAWLYPGGLGTIQDRLQDFLERRSQGTVPTDNGQVIPEPAALYGQAIMRLVNLMNPARQPTAAQQATLFKRGLLPQLRTALEAQLMTLNIAGAPPPTLANLIDYAQQIQDMLQPPNYYHGPNYTQGITPPTPQGIAHQPAAPGIFTGAPQPTNLQAMHTISSAQPFMQQQPQHTYDPYALYLPAPSSQHHASGGGGLYTPMVQPAQLPAIAPAMTTTIQGSSVTDAYLGELKQLQQGIAHTVDTAMSGVRDAMTDVKHAVAHLNAVGPAQAPPTYTNRQRPREREDSPARYTRPRYDSSPRRSPYRRAYDRRSPSPGRPQQEERFCNPCYQAGVRYDHPPRVCWGPCTTCHQLGHKPYACPQARSHYGPTQQPPQLPAPQPATPTINMQELQTAFARALRDHQETQSVAHMQRAALQERSVRFQEPTRNSRDQSPARS